MIKYCAGWLVHLLTASTAVLGLATIIAIVDDRPIDAFWLMWVAIVIDAMDGTLARRLNVAKTIQRIDGALLDNMVDFLNYVITPSFFIYAFALLPEFWDWPLLTCLIIASTYQFCQSDAKTDDHFFKGFPCYWNLVAFYMFMSASNPVLNALIIAVLCVMVFVPIKYVYPSRMRNIASQHWIRNSLLALSIIYGFVTLAMLLSYPVINPLLVIYSILYMVLYLAVSIYRTYRPLNLHP